MAKYFFTSSATEANNTILQRCIPDLGVRRIISAPTEHHSILHTLAHIKKEIPGISVVMLDVDHHGRIDLAALETLLATSTEKTLVSLMYGNNEIGTMHDMEAISSLCEKHHALLHCDAVQVVGKYKIDLQNIKLSFMSATAHKFHGPKGSGFFYMNGANIIQPYIYGGAQERNMRAGTENVAGIAGLADALTVATDVMEIRKQHVEEIKSHFESRLFSELTDIRFNNPTDTASMYHISSVSFPGSPQADMLMFNLDIEGIAASSGSACSAGIEEDSHVLQAIRHDSSRKTVRFSFSFLNTMEEADAVVDKLKSLLPHS
ncbi:MAG: aminotransferase class V-fold PLP-dependent enzyme [Saprospiraceae bacterium]|nr:aminotransferase class V-fold PLP-dependent enzyme [Saprospiraceae bacterium]